MNDSAVLDALLTRLLGSNFHLFTLCMADLLSTLGWQEATPAARPHLRGKNHAGGYDLSGFLQVGLSRRRVIAQIKQRSKNNLLFQRNVDELRGAALRAGASEAYLLTTGKISDAALEKELRGASTRLLPVHLVEGEALAMLLVKHGIGITRTKDGFALDEGYFARLSARAVENGRKELYRQSKDKPGTNKSDAILTFRVEGIPAGVHPTVVWQA